MKQTCGNTTAGLYSRFADRWQRGIDRLGFTGAYRDLMTTESRLHGIALQGRKLLDVGTGTGAFALAWLGVNPGRHYITLTDTSPEMLRLADQALRAQAFHPALSEQSIGANDFACDYDQVLCAHVIEHTPDAEESLSWLVDRLRPGGRLLLSVSKPHWCTALVRWRWGHQAFRPDDVLAMMANCGLSDARAHPYANGPPSRVSCGFSAVKPE